MIPLISSSNITAPYIYRQRRRTVPLTDFEQGGKGIEDSSEGSSVQLWEAGYNGTAITVGVEGQALSPVLAVANVERVALAFDQSMRTHLAYTVGPDSFFWWFDSQSGQMETLSLPGVSDACITLDDHRPEFSGISDIILAYTRNSDLYVRVQRERYQTERLLFAGVPSTELTAVGMNKVNRLQYRFRPT